MPKGRYATLTSWSFSVYTQYIRCPFSVCLEKIQRIRITEPPNPTFERGNRAHDAARDYVNGTGKAPKIVQELVPVTKDLVALRTAKARAEQDWSFDRNWNPVAWNDWDRVWLRIKTDACADTKEPPTVRIVDWKTGKVYPEHKQQRSLYALGGLQLVELGVLAGGSKDVQLTAEHIYIDTGQSATEKFQFKHLKKLKQEWMARIKQMMSDTVFQPIPSKQNCRYCKFAKSRGGPCASEAK